MPTSPYGFHRIHVTLTGTTNPYLADRLPLDGELTVHEMATDGYAMDSKVTFRAADASKIGGLGAPVHVAQAEYTVKPRPKPGPALSATQLDVLRHLADGDEDFTEPSYRRARGELIDLGLAEWDPMAMHITAVLTDDGFEVYNALGGA